jgi:NAD(P)-dependent dehydrogenase (short-subunit alcohol dehydrogenase family)
VNAIAPGFTLSGENEENISEQGKQANVRARMLQRAAVPTDLLGTLVFLASDDSDFITGQTIAVDERSRGRYKTLLPGGEQQRKRCDLGPLSPSLSPV